MGDPGGGHGEAAPSLTRSLNRDALEEVFLHCEPADLLAMRATCKSAARLLDGSEKVWLAKLRKRYRLHLKAVSAAADGVFWRLARRVFEASSSQELRFQGVYVNGGVDEDAMHYFVDNLFRHSKAPYCSNCSRDADCVAVLLDGEVPRDAEYARVRQYLLRRCRYAAALILNVQMPDQGRDPDDIMHILEDWTDMQLEGFFTDLVGAMQAQHALGRLLLYDIAHDRLEAEEDKILRVHQWLLDRPKQMLGGMLRPPGDRNTMLDTSAVPKLAGQEAAARLAGVVHEVSLSRMGSLTCPVSAGAVVLGSIDCSKIAGWSSEDVLALLQSAAADPAAAALNGMQEADAVEAAAAAGLLPPILATDECLAGIWHEFDTSPEAAQRQAAAAEAAGRGAVAGSQQGQQQQQGAGQAAAAAAPGSAPGPSGGQPATRVVSHQGIITWRPLLWFKYHSAAEAIAFVQRHRQLVEQRGMAATVRHRGPPPTCYGHVPAPAAGQQADQPEHGQGGAAQPGQQQQAVAVGVPVPAGFAAAMPGAGPGHEAMLGVPAAGDAQGAAAPPAPPHLLPLPDEEESSDGEEDDGSGGSSSEGSDSDEAAGEEGGWLHPWVHNEFGADLQLQQEPAVDVEEGLGFEQMEEGSSSEEDEGEGDHFLPQPAAAPGWQAAGAVPPAPGQAPVQHSAAQTLLRALTDSSTRARNRLTMTLSSPVGGNLVLVKLIDQENLMDQFGDTHSFPNIDMTHVSLRGKQVELPAGVTMAP